MNLAATLKSEIARIARKEIKAEVQQLRKASTQSRSDIAALKRRLAELERAVGRAAKSGAPKAPPQATAGERPLRMTFSPTGLAAQRRRLGLSAQELGVLLGVSGQSIYKWEQGKTRPRATQLVALRTIRSVGKREVARRLSSSLQQQ